MSHFEIAQQVVEENKLGPSTDYDAVIVTNENAIAGRVLHGQIYFDSHERFDDGTPIHTSTVQSVSVLPNTQALKVQTRNTTYLVAHV